MRSLPVNKQQNTISPVARPASHAVVLGGSLAGMAAAGILSRFFDKVTLVERDVYPEGAKLRSGVPHARHAHGLLLSGVTMLERIFPGFEALSCERGAHALDYGTDMIILGEKGWAPRKPGMRGLTASRVLFDSVCLELLRRIPSVEIRERTEAMGLRIERDGRGARVAGVELRDRGTGQRFELAADLVVDTCGRGSKTLDWLSAAGFARPEETVVDAHSSYSSRWFQAPEGFGVDQQRWWKGGFMQFPSAAPDTMALLFPIEDSRWIVSLARCGNKAPPSGEQEFMEALRALPSPFIADAVKMSEPVSPVYCHRGAANRFRHYERWGARLGGFIAMGDAVCGFNPVYGQGMSSALMCAGILEDTLRAVGPLSADLPARFFKAQARWLQNPWALATGADFRFESTTGKRPRMGKVVGPYMRMAFEATRHDDTVRDCLLEIMNLMKPVTALFSPKIVARVLWSALRPGAGEKQSRPIPALPGLDDAMPA
jgi:2-polyprenyl-6-methoxyphenol hydroxylase-like FAD-dependent oxidoreductase